MLHCIYCDYLKAVAPLDISEFCKEYLCEYSNIVLSDESIHVLSEYPCSRAKKLLFIKA